MPQKERPVKPVKEPKPQHLKKPKSVKAVEEEAEEQLPDTEALKNAAGLNEEPKAPEQPKMPAEPAPPAPLPPLPALPPLPDLPKIPGFEAFGYTVPGSSMSSEGRLQVPPAPVIPANFNLGGEEDANLCDKLPDVLVIDKSQLPKPKVKLI